MSEERPSEEHGKANKGSTNNTTQEIHYNAQDDLVDGAKVIREGGGGGVWKWYFTVDGRILDMVDKMGLVGHSWVYGLLYQLLGLRR